MTNHPNRKLTPSVKAMMQLMASGPMLTMTLLSSGGGGRAVLMRAVLMTLIAEDWAELCDHPTVVIDRITGRPATAARLTDAGRAALGISQTPERPSIMQWSSEMASHEMWSGLDATKTNGEVRAYFQKWLQAAFSAGYQKGSEAVELE